jgi:hypothetical protein
MHFVPYPIYGLDERRGLLGTLRPPIYRSEPLDGLGECFESAELGVTVQVIPRCSTSGEGHRVVLVPHPYICREGKSRRDGKQMYFARTVCLWDLWAREGRSDLAQE